MKAAKIRRQKASAGINGRRNVAAKWRKTENICENNQRKSLRKYIICRKSSAAAEKVMKIIIGEIVMAWASASQVSLCAAASIMAKILLKRRSK